MALPILVFYHPSAGKRVQVDPPFAGADPRMIQ